MNDPTSESYSSMETLICSALGDAMLSLYRCYVHDFDCDGNDNFQVTAHILVNGAVNYVNNEVTANKIKNELDSYDGMLYVLLYIIFVCCIICYVLSLCVV